jgi:hypothetical protein
VIRTVDPNLVAPSKWEALQKSYPSTEWDKIFMARLELAIRTQLFWLDLLEVVKAAEKARQSPEVGE